MIKFGICALVSLMPLTLRLYAQTACAAVRSERGVFICYPNPHENAGDEVVPSLFHISAQANAAAGHKIHGYVVLIDGRPVYQIQLSIPLERLSIETNVRSPVTSGVHKVGVVVDGTGSAEIGNIQFSPSTTLGFCDPFNSVDARSCLTSRIREPLQWSTRQLDGTNDGFSGYVDYLRLYSQNLKSIEADVADAVAVDAIGNLYVASHSSADIEVRKYTPDGSLTYDHIVRSCGKGFSSVAGVAVDNSGRIWIAGNTTACISTTPNALETQISEPTELHGFLMLMDTTAPSSAPPGYVTFLSRVKNRITALRVDGEGNAYVTGTAASAEFAHQSIFTAGSLPGTRIGFVSALNASGSALLWSTLFRGAQLNALALDSSANVYLTGRIPSRRLNIASDDVLVAELSDSGRRLSYLADIGGSGTDEGRAISVNGSTDWVLLTGATNSTDFVRHSDTTDSHRTAETFALALQPCRNGTVYSEAIGTAKVAGSAPVVSQPALDSFTRAFSGIANHGRPSEQDKNSHTLVQSASSCSSSTR